MCIIRYVRSKELAEGRRKRFNFRQYPYIFRTNWEKQGTLIVTNCIQVHSRTDRLQNTSCEFVRYNFLDSVKHHNSHITRTNKHLSHIADVRATYELPTRIWWAVLDNNICSNPKQLVTVFSCSHLLHAGIFHAKYVVKCLVRHFLSAFTTR